MDDASSKRPLKKLHRISNRTLVVIDESLVEQFLIDKNDIWVEQLATDNGILLKFNNPNTEKYEQLEKEQPTGRNQ
jgi:hypothetical protein